jgi:hypothetical protein
MLEDRKIFWTCQEWNNCHLEVYLYPDLYIGWQIPNICPSAETSIIKWIRNAKWTCSNVNSQTQQQTAVSSQLHNRPLYSEGRATRTIWIRGWMVSIVGLDLVECTTICCRCQESNYYASVFQTVVQALYWFG